MSTDKNEALQMAREIVAVLGPNVPKSVTDTGARWEWQHALELSRSLVASLTAPASTAGEADSLDDALAMDNSVWAAHMREVIDSIATPPSASSTAGEAEELARCKSSRARWIAMSSEFEHRLETLRSTLWAIVDHWNRRADESEHGPAYASCALEIKAELIDDASTPPSASSSETRKLEYCGDPYLREIVKDEFASALLAAGVQFMPGGYIDTVADEVLRRAYYPDGNPSASSSAAAGAVDGLTLERYKPNSADYNGCHGQAIRALRYLAEYDRPIGGEEFPNRACCLQIASELEQSFKAITAALTTQREDRADG